MGNQYDYIGGFLLGLIRGYIRFSIIRGSKVKIEIVPVLT